MAELIYRHTARVKDEFGSFYLPLVYGEPRGDGMWEGWLEFLALEERPQALRTGRETTQPNKTALRYWATGLEPVYLAGAFDRAA